MRGAAAGLRSHDPVQIDGPPARLRMSGAFFSRAAAGAEAGRVAVIRLRARPIHGPACAARGPARGSVHVGAQSRGALATCPPRPAFRLRCDDRRGEDGGGTDEPLRRLGAAGRRLSLRTTADREDTIQSARGHARRGGRQAPGRRTRLVRLKMWAISGIANFSFEERERRLGRTPLSRRQCERACTAVAASKGAPCQTPVNIREPALASHKPGINGGTMEPRR